MELTFKSIFEQKYCSMHAFLISNSEIHLRFVTSNFANNALLGLNERKAPQSWE